MPLILAVLAGLASAFAWGVASLVFGRFLRDAPAGARPSANAANLSKVLLALVFFGGAWALVGGPFPASSTTRTLLLSGALGFAVGDSCYLAALPRCGVQTAAMIGLLNVLVAGVLGWVLFGEALAPATMGAMGIVLLGVLLVLADQRGERARDPRAWRIGLGFAVLNAVCIGTAVAVGFGGMQGAEILPATFLRVAGGALALLVIGAGAGLLPGAGGVDGGLRDLARPYHSRSMWKPLFVAGFFGSVLGLWPYHYALQNLPPGVSAIVFSTTPLFTLPLGLFFGERQGRLTVLGTLIGFLGIAAVVWSARPQEVQPPALDVRRLETPLAIGGRFPVVAAHGERAWALWTRALEDGGDALETAEVGRESWGAPQRVAAGGPWFVNWADTPALAVGADGPSRVTWLAMNGDGTYTYEVHTAHPTDGAWPGSGVRLHRDATAAEHGFVSLVPLRGGGVQAVWLDGHATASGGAMSLHTMRAGEPASEVELDARVCDCCATALVETADGALVAAYRDRSADEVRDLALVRRPAGSREWSAPRVPHADGWRIEGCPVNGPALAADGERVVLVAFSMGADDEARVWLAFSDDAGATFGERVRIDEGVPSGRADVAFLAHDVALVSWLEQAHGQPAWRARTVTRAGALGAPVTVAEVSGERGDGRLRLARVGDAALAVWTDAEEIAPCAAWLVPRESE